MLQLSSDPSIQRLQLDELLLISQQTLKVLTSPIAMYPELEREYIGDIYGYHKLDYQPPPCRFAVFSTYREVYEQHD